MVIRVARVTGVTRVTRVTGLVTGEVGRPRVTREARPGSVTSILIHLTRPRAVD